MIDFINGIISGDLPELLGDLYVPTVATVVASWGIIAFGGAVSVFAHAFEVLLNYRRR